MCPVLPRSAVLRPTTPLCGGTVRRIAGVMPSTSELRSTALWHWALVLRHTDLLHYTVAGCTTVMRHPRCLYISSMYWGTARIRRCNARRTAARVRATSPASDDLPGHCICCSTVGSWSSRKRRRVRSPWHVRSVYRGPVPLRLPCFLQLSVHLLSLLQQLLVLLLERLRLLPQHGSLRQGLPLELAALLLNDLVLLHDLLAGRAAPPHCKVQAALPEVVVHRHVVERPLLGKLLHQARPQPLDRRPGLLVVAQPKRDLATCHVLGQSLRRRGLRWHGLRWRGLRWHGLLNHDRCWALDLHHQVLLPPYVGLVHPARPGVTRHNGAHRTASTRPQPMVNQQVLVLCNLRIHALELLLVGAEQDLRVEEAPDCLLLLDAVVYDTHKRLLALAGLDHDELPPPEVQAAARRAAPEFAEALLVALALIGTAGLAPADLLKPAHQVVHAADSLGVITRDCVHRARHPNPTHCKRWAGGRAWGRHPNQ
mmetsp:Transcript_75350/g.243699  ORF Transcript_75350/g.243699 Transcript_75350/m.243699 type:complete len:483 (+) Transcript_75350:1115-2563(+)